VNADIKKRWIEALRSGKFKQGRKVLMTEGNRPMFCCLGVLCELYREEKGGEWSTDRDGCRTFLDERCILPFPVMDWAELTNQSPRVGEYGLADLNDEGTPFREIAKLIKRHL
jgi:hypothetical protein